MDYAALKAELDNDPMSRGYAGMSDAAVADDLNEQRYTVTRNIPRDEAYVQARIDVGDVVGPVAYSTEEVACSRAEVLGFGSPKTGNITSARK